MLVEAGALGPVLVEAGALGSVLVEAGALASDGQWLGYWDWVSALGAAHVWLCAQSRLCAGVDRSPPGSSVRGVFHQEYLSELPFPSPGDLLSSDPARTACVSCISRIGFITTESPGKPAFYISVLTLCGAGSGTPLQCSCLENPMDGGAWWAAVHGVARRT